jgi:hypothetical protein
MLALAAKHVTHSEVYACGVIDPHGSIWLCHRLKEMGLGALERRPA